MWPTTCPVCGARVFFLQADNGGRVFFDPPPGPPWPKHPCTDNGAPVPYGDLFDPDDLEVAGGMEFAVRPRSGSTWFLSTGNDHYSIDPTPLIFGRIQKSLWPVTDEAGETTSLLVMDGEWTSHELKVKRADKPKPITSADRRKLSLLPMWQKPLANVRRHVPGLNALVRDPSTGAFLLGQAGRSQVIVIPVPDDMDSSDYSQSLPDDYMDDAYSRCRRLLDKTPATRRQPLYRDIVVFVIANPFGNYDSVSSWTPIYQDIENLAGAIHWFDLNEPRSLELSEIAATSHDLGTDEEAFCSKFTGRKLGRWKSLEVIASRLGVRAQFDAAHSTLRSQGFALSHDDLRFELEMTYVRLPGAAPTNCARVRLLFHLSSPDKGLAACATSLEETQSPPALAWINTGSDLIALLGSVLPDP